MGMSGRTGQVNINFSGLHVDNKNTKKSGKNKVHWNKYMDLFLFYGCLYQAHIRMLTVMKKNLEI